MEAEPEASSPCLTTSGADHGTQSSNVGTLGGTTGRTIERFASGARQLSTDVPLPWPR
jgi:hypothetical protein